MLAAVTIGVGSINLGKLGLWRDEAFSGQLASLPAHTFLRFLSSEEPNGALYHLLLFGWVRLGEGDAFLRFPSVVFAAGSIALTFLLGRHLLGQQVAIVGALMLACNATFLANSRETRSYSLLLLLSTASSLLFARAVLDDRKAAWHAYSIAATAAMYCHYFACLTIVAQFASLLFLPERATKMRRACYSGIVIGVLTSPLVIFALGDRPDSLTWVPPTTPRRIAAVTTQLLGGHASSIVLLSLLVATLVVWSRGFEEASQNRNGWSIRFLVLLTIVPLGIGILVSLLKPILIGRYFLGVLPPLMLIAAVGAVSVYRGLLQRRAVVGSVLLAILLTLSTSRYFLKATKPDSRGGVEYVTSHAQPGDGLAFVSFWGIPAFQWYAVRRNPRSVSRLHFVFPRPEKASLVGDDLWKSDFLVQSAPRAFDPVPVQRAVRDHARVWLIEDGGGDKRVLAEKELLAGMLRDKLKCEEHNFRGVIVSLFASNCTS
jgi:mannosyltransferase